MYLLSLLAATFVAAFLGLMLCLSASVGAVRRGSRGDAISLACQALIGGALLLFAFAAGSVLLAVSDAEDGGTTSAPPRPCRAVVPDEKLSSISGYHVQLIPLDFVCDSEDLEAEYRVHAVPRAVNLGAVVLLSAGVVLASTRRAIRDR